MFIPEKHCNKSYFDVINSNTRFVFLQGGTRCFYPNQLVITNNGSKKISEISVNDNVLTYNEKSKVNEFKPVNEVLSFENSKKTYEVTLKNGNKIICTEDHEFFYKGGWVNLKHLLSLHDKLKT